VISEEDTKTKDSMGGLFPPANKLLGRTVRQANKYREVFKVKEIRAPNCKWYEPEIPKFFEATDYQRVLNRLHTYRIVESIVNNTFYDNTIRVLKIGTNKYKIIDGQHRLSALWILHTQYGVQTYDLALQIFPEQEQREVFRKINAGKGLKPQDILKNMKLIKD